jgi:hypothetical protein
MKPHLHINIKGKKLWKICALVIMAIFITCCFVDVLSIDQPITATAGDTIPITLNDSTFFNISINYPNCPCPNFEDANYIFGLLAPTGWAASTNAKISYTSTLGNGNMVLMPANAVEPDNGKGLNWPAAALAKFGVRKNLVKDVEWVIFESPQQYVLQNTATLIGTFNIKFTVGADGNNTSYFPSYLVADSYDGYHDYGPTTPDYNVTDGACLVQTGGKTGILHDYCNPQLTSVNPPKSLSNEFITLTYNNKLDLNTQLVNNTDIYLCIDSAYKSDGTVITGVCVHNESTHLIQTSANSGLYSLTFWPRSFFGLTGTTTITKLVYTITNADGSLSTGYGGNPAVPFSYYFGCN